MSEPAAELGLKGAGVEPLSIPALNKVIATYEQHKERRCAESPGEMAAKKELKFALQQHAAQLPQIDGKPFYRFGDRDYILDQKMVIKHVADDETDD